MILDCISDLHGHYPKLEGGDLLIVAGDLTARDDFQGWLDFVAWLQLSKYKKKIVIGGNHDGWFVKNPPDANTFGDDCSYLCDSGTEFSYYIDGFPKEDEGFLPSGKRTLKIWGSPWTKTFPGMNPKCKAFTVDTEEELASKFSLIPDDIDILITHSPPYGIFDETDRDECVGSTELIKQMFKVKPKLMVFGHIHEQGGKSIDLASTICVNASHVNEHYQPVNKAVRIIL